jgi:hypothetical protein
MHFSHTLIIFKIKGELKPMHFEPKKKEKKTKELKSVAKIGEVQPNEKLQLKGFKNKLVQNMEG